MTGLQRVALVGLIALRSLTSHRRRSAFVGGILALGTALVMIGLALLDSIEASMEASITESLAGDFQVYSTQGRDRLALFGGSFMGMDDVGRVDHVGRARGVIESVPGVGSVVPMGVDFATISRPGELESILADMRAATYESGELPAEKVARARELVTATAAELERRLEITNDPERLRAALTAVRSADSDAFWSGLSDDPLGALEFLDTKVAVHAKEGAIIYFRYLGTDLERFVDEFDRFHMVEGEPIPAGTRGLLFNRKFYEEQIKHPVARGLDRLRRMRQEQELSLETDPLARTIARRVKAQWRRVTYQLDATAAESLRAELAEFLDRDAPLSELLPELLEVDDASFDERYAFFYDHVAPRIDLYDLDVGDIITVRTFTRLGFLKSINVRLYGVFEFAGLDSSDLAGSNNIVDLVTFRELYGLMTPDRARELDAIRASAGLGDVTRDEAEDALFGEDDGTLVDASAAVESFDEFDGVDLEGLRGRSERVVDASFDRADLDDGIALSLAVLLDGTRPADAVKRELRSAIERAELPLQVVTWQEASGLIGQFITVIRFVLYIAIVIIFAVALVIINNSTVTATLERIPEIGTMRAIGAQRGLVLSLFLAENMALSLIAGLVGVGVGALVLFWLGQVGIPAWQQVLVFLFGGPRLYPSFTLGHGLIALVAVSLVTLGSALYPARLAAAVQPVTAMQDRTEAHGTFIAIAVRNLIQARRRTLVLAFALALVTSLLVMLLSLSSGLSDTLLRAATTLSTGHVNVGGFFKTRPSDAAPLVRPAQKIRDVVEANTPGLKFAVERTRGFARLVSPTTSLQAGLTGIDIDEETEFARRIRMADESEYVEGGRDEVVGDIGRLRDPGTAMLFAAQAKRLQVRIGDRLTVVAETPQGARNSTDLEIVAVAKDIGFLSNFGIFVHHDAVRTLYAFDDDVTGAVYVYLHDHEQSHAVMGLLRDALEEAGFELLEHDATPFFTKFGTVAGQSWTGQRLDLTVWEDEVLFLTWVLNAVDTVSFALVSVLVVLIAIGIMNSMWIGVRERTNEIGTLRAIGMSRRRVLAMFLLEALFLGAFSTVVGGIAGSLLALGIDALALPIPSPAVRAILMSDRLHLVVEPIPVVFAVLAFTGLAALAALPPAVAASRMQPVTAIHHIG